MNPEVGGCYLGPETSLYYTGMMMRGLEGMMRHLEMIEGEVMLPRQIDFDTRARRELRPKNSGYLVSYYEKPEQFGQLVKGGTKLGEIVDMYTYRVIEEIAAPFGGYLFFSRYSGMVGGGT